MTATAAAPTQAAPTSSAASASSAAAAPAQASSTAASSAPTIRADSGPPSSDASKTKTPLAEDAAKALGDAVKSLQDYVKPLQTVTIQVDHDTGQSYVKIVNAQTKQMVLQIPSAQVLAMAHKLQQMDSTQGASGVLVDQQG